MTSRAALVLLGRGSPAPMGAAGSCVPAAPAPTPWGRSILRGRSRPSHGGGYWTPLPTIAGDVVIAGHGNQPATRANGGTQLWQFLNDGNPDGQSAMWIATGFNPHGAIAAVALRPA